MNWDGVILDLILVGTGFLMGMWVMYLHYDFKKGRGK